jgi:hypothetical protein
MARARNTADTQTASGGPVSPNIAGKNAIINGGMDIWQRGTSISASASTAPYNADRWQINLGANQASTISRQATGDTTNLPGIQYCARVQRNSGQTGTGAFYFVQSLETANSIQYAGKTVTLSFYARAGANFSPTSSYLTSYVYYGTGTDQNITGSYTGAVGLGGQNNTLTTTWQRFTMTVSIASTATELALFFAISPTGTASTNDYFEITGVQLELGSVATPFSRAGGTIQGELAACQRYYYRAFTSTGTAGPVGPGHYYNSTQAWATITFPVSLRTTPTLDSSTGSGYYQWVINNAAQYATSVGINDVNVNCCTIRNTSMTGLSGGQAGTFLVNASGAYLGFSAEL